MADKTTRSEYDVVVIGAGISGLTAAALLVKAGLSVVLIEEQARLGGYFMGFKRRGYFFDSAIQWLNQCGRGGIVHKIFTHLGSDAPVCPNMSRIRRYKSESFDYLLTNEPDNFRDQLITDYPGERVGIIRFFVDCKKIGDHFAILKRRMRATESMSVLERATFGLKMLCWVLPVWKYLKMSADAGLGSYFKTAGIKKIFCSEEKFMSVIMPIAWAYTSDYQAPPVGGAETFVYWLRSKIEKASAQILLNCPVQKVVVKNNTAVGVLLANGQTIFAKFVIAACDVQTLYEKMLPAGAVPQKLLRQLKEADLYYSSVSVFIGLDCEASVIGLSEEMTCITEENICQAEHAGRDPYKISLTIQSPSARDKTLAPPGKATMTIHCAAWMDYENNWKTEQEFGRGQAYKEFKEQYADILIARVEKVMKVDIRSHIVVLEIATPITYWRYTGNRDGSIMGASPSAKNIKNKIAHYKTPVKNLFLGGHWAEYGGGMPMAVKAAANVSLLILKQSKKEEFNKLRDVMDGR